MNTSKILLLFLLMFVSLLFIGQASATTFTIRGSGGDATWSENSTMDNTTQDSGDYYVKVGRWADNFEDNNEDWTIFSGKTAMDLSTVQAIGTYSFRMDAGNEAERYNYSLNITNITSPHSIIVKVYDNGIGNANTWVVHVSNGTSSYFMGVDTTAAGICPSANLTHLCYRTYLQYKQNSTVSRPSSAGWVIIQYEFNGTHVNGYINENQVFSEVDATGLINISVGNLWAASGIAYFDEVRVTQTTSGNVTTWHNWTDGNVTYQVVVNATTPANTNYSVSLYNNITGTFIESLGSNLSGNQTLAVANPVQDSRVNITLYGNETSTPELISVTYYSQGMFMPPVPVIGTVTTGNFWKNITYTTGSGNVTNGYNISRNGTWYNGTATFLNTTTVAHGWINDTIYAWNSSGTGSLSSSLTNNTQIPNNAPIQSAIGSKSVNENQWLNITITSTDADGDDLTYDTNATKGTLTTNSFSWLPNLADAGTYYWTFNTTDNYSAVDTETITITVNNIDFIPPVPVISTVTTGNFYINTTWTSGSGNITDGYNSTNGSVWINNTLPYRNTTLSAHAWQNLTVYAWNSSYGNLSATSLTNNTRIPNNIPSNITLLTPTNGSAVTSIPVNFTWNAGTDDDSDILTYDLRVNRTTVSTGITVNYILYSLVSGANNWSVRSYDGYNYSNWSVVYDITYSEESTTTTGARASYGGGGSGWAIESLNKTTPVTTITIQKQEESIISLSTNNFTFYYKTKSPTTLRVYDMSFRSECETVKLTISNTNDIVSINTSCNIQGSNIRFIVPNTQTPDSVYYKIYDLLWVKKASVPTDMTSDGKYLAVLVKDSDAGQYTFIQSNPLYELQQVVSNPAIIIDILKAIDKEIYSDLSKKVDFKWWSR